MVLELRHSQAQTDFDLESGRLRFFLDIRVTVDTVQGSEDWDEMGREEIRQLETMMARALSEQVLALAKRLQGEGQDILGFAEAVWSRSPDLWEHIAEDWRIWLRDSEIDVEIGVKIKT